MSLWGISFSQPISSNSNSKWKRQKSVRFCPYVNIVQISTRNETRSLFRHLYWSSNNYDDFMKEAFAELTVFINKTGLTAQEARRELYQPESTQLSETATESSY